GATVMLPYGCGDGVRDADEDCDDGNLLPGDGCNGLCRLEPNAVCPELENCHLTAVCGNGIVNIGEACDDANTVTGDGCSGDCSIIELGFGCPRPGKACERHYDCGDGHLDPTEQCDDGNRDLG